MEQIIDHIDRTLLEDELKPFFVRKTNKGDNEINGIHKISGDT